jgi:hypothetical protein
MLNAEIAEALLVKIDRHGFKLSTNRRFFQVFNQIITPDQPEIPFVEDMSLIVVVHHGQPAGYLAAKNMFGYKLFALSAPRKITGISDLRSFNFSHINYLLPVSTQGKVKY